MTRFAVEPELLRWARTRAGRTVEDLARRFPKLEKWESREVTPTLRQLEDYAKATHAPFGYLLLPHPPEEQLAVPVFRTVRDAANVDRPSPELIDTIQTMQRRQAWMRDLLLQDAEPPLDFVGSAEIGQPTVAIANHIRQVLGLAPGWARQKPSWTDALRTFREAAESAGVVVAANGVVGNNTHRKLDPQEFRGFVLVDSYAPFVFLNAADAKGAQMFTLAHELAHVWFGISAVFDLAELQPAMEPSEIACNAVAAEFLVPAAELREVWRDALREREPFQMLARHFKVSSIVAARRALDLTLIARNTFFEFYRAYVEDDRRKKVSKKSEGGNFYATQNVRLGRRFGETVVRAAAEGRLLYRDAYALTGLWGATFDRYAAGLKGGA